ncbi:MFS general substrate transporter [Myriangium duriaei CBS 260.36]|uniref:MFS general substrate transporter n=1 Tax=Myriangium duriaei CBS 260.36 TaxID=1168546 RepID=A0A9P4IUP7_9PEZI|nr:MFS general substrate transporter [Myriangium duriaei CBS 260.36]
MSNSFDSPPTTSSVDSMPPKQTEKKGILRFLSKTPDNVDQPPDGGLTAWLQVLGCFFVFMNTFGVAFTFGVYQVYYETIMLPTHSASAIAWIGTLQSSLIMIVGILSGPLFDKGLFFPVLLVGSVGLIFSFMMLSICKVYWQVILCQGLLAGISCGLLYIPSISQVPLYFSSKKGRAVSIVTAGGPFGGIIYPLMLRYLIPSVGFAKATRAVGFLILALQITAIVLIKPLNVANRPKKLRDPTMFKDPSYVAYLIAAFIYLCCVFIPYFDCGIFYLAKFDLNLDHAFYTLLIINAGNVVGRLLLPSLTDFGIGADSLMNISCGSLVALGFGWIGIKTKAAYYVWLILWGILSAGVMTLPAVEMPFLCPRPEVFATRMGLVFAVGGIGLLISAPIANALIKHQTNYLGAQLWIGITATLGLPFVIYSGIGARRNRKAFMAAKGSKQSDAIPLDSSKA